ncbi:protein of unknown function [Blastococcus saxobsidens DD2]|uniref:Uncharacterized protein n=1 Tax=Blastococcus saxobsidens (strain DD2) TaxID=1146883 RepID=H6RLD7_BLASD|nr:protein of unknown function [Blastococcus saxobsidens DD2]
MAGPVLDDVLGVRERRRRRGSGGGVHTAGAAHVLAMRTAGLRAATVALWQQSPKIAAGRRSDCSE